MAKGGHDNEQREGAGGGSGDGRKEGSGLVVQQPGAASGASARPELPGVYAFSSSPMERCSIALTSRD